MFSNLKIFYLFSFLLILVSTIIAGTYFRSVAVSSIISETTEKGNDVLANYFIGQVWPGQDPNFSTNVNSSNLTAYKSDPTFINFQARAAAFAAYVPLVRIAVYTKDGSLLFENSNTTIGNESDSFSKNFLALGDQKQAFDRAINGKTYSHILSKAVYHNSKGEVIESSLVRTYLPIIDPSSKQVEGLLELVTDITTEWNYLESFQLYVTSGIIAIFILLYGTLFYNSARAAKIIEKQLLENQQLADAKAKAETENQEKSKFLANVSHELRTPLNAIIGFSEMIKNEVAGPLNNVQYRDYINDIHNSGVHLLSLINDILDYSKAMAEKLSIESVEIDVNKIAASSMRLIKPRADEVKVELKEEYPDKHLIMLGDPKRLKQIFLNLLSNSVKFTPEGHFIKIRLVERLDKKEVEIQVIDTGIGISAKDVAKAMASFGQVDNKLSRRYEGTGLGLPLTKKLVEMMSGRFEVQSEVGIGTTITISFPLLRSSAAPIAESENHEQPTALENSILLGHEVAKQKAEEAKPLETLKPIESLKETELTPQKTPETGFADLKPQLEETKPQEAANFFDQALSSSPAAKPIEHSQQTTSTSIFETENQVTKSEAVTSTNIFDKSSDKSMFQTLEAQTDTRNQHTDINIASGDTLPPENIGNEDFVKAEQARQKPALQNLSSQTRSGDSLPPEHMEEEDNGVKSGDSPPPSDIDHN